MGERLINQKFNVHNKDNEMNIVNPYRYTATSTVYDDAVFIFSLRKFFNWNTAVLKIRRSSDNATAYVFFNGAISYDTITTSSYISTTSSTIPSTTTLSTWISTSNGFVEEWYAQDNVGNNYKVIQTTTSAQPQIVNGGSIITKGSLPAVEFTSSQKYLYDTTGFSELNSGNDFSIFTVSSCNSTGNKFTILSTLDAPPSRFFMLNDRQTSKRLALIVNTTPTTYAADLTAQVNSANQRLLAAIVSGTDLISHYNGTLQNTTAFTTPYSNNEFRIGVDTLATNYLDGTIQEIIAYPSDKTSVLSDIHTDINSHYSIY